MKVIVSPIEMRRRMFAKVAATLDVDEITDLIELCHEAIANGSTWNDMIALMERFEKIVPDLDN